MIKINLINKKIPGNHTAGIFKEGFKDAARTVKDYTWGKAKFAGGHAWTATKFTGEYGWKGVKGIAKAPGNRYVQYGAGVVAGLVALYGIMKDGFLKGKRNANEEMGSNYVDHFVQDESSAKYSHLNESAKEIVTGYKFDDPVYPFWIKTKNVGLSMAGEALNNVFNIAATVGAIGAPLALKSKTAGKGIATACAGFLFFKGGKFVLADVLGIGKDGS